MTDASVSVAECHPNKENQNQGNSEQKELETDDPISNFEAFQSKYSNLRRKWLDGHQGGDADENESTDFGEHEYISQFILDGNDENKEIVFHPTYTYSYTDYEKECILPSLDQNKLQQIKERFQSHIDRLERKILKGIKDKEDQKRAEDEQDNEESDEANQKEKGGWIVPEFCVPIRADIRKFDFAKLAEQQKKIGGRLFDAIMMDPPWQLATANPTRGVALGYNQLGDNIISGIPVHLLQDNGLIFIWVINAKYRLALELFKKWGYQMIADIAWVKQTVNRRIANGHGYYLQHAKETCLVGLKGDFDQLNINRIKGVCSDIIYSERRGQSQKPEEIYQYIEKVVPNGFYMEVFGRRNNLRNGWLTIGNEL